MVLRCQICGVNRRTIKETLSHYRKVHENDAQFMVECEVPGCHSTFRKSNSYKTHLSRKHKEFPLDEPPQDEALERPPVEERDPEDGIRIADDLDDADAEMEENDDTQRKSAQYILHLKCTEGLTEKSVGKFVSGYSGLVKSTIDSLKTSVETALINCNVDFNEIPDLPACFDHDSKIANPFVGLETKTQRTRYFEDNFGLVRPRRVVLGNSTAIRRKGNKAFQTLKSDEIMYVPLLESLQYLLNDNTVLNEIMNPHQRDDDILADFCDGEHFKTHPLFSIDIHALQLILYYDEFEVTNPLGTKTGKHKLGVLYYTLGNIRPELRSQLKAIQLLCIAEHPIILKYGMDEFLKPFMEDLQSLEKDGGHEFDVKKQKRSFSGTIAFFSGDNLGSQQVGGFKEGTATERRCRQCLGTKEETRQFFRESDFEMRSHDSHEHHCDLVEEDKEQGKVYGINRHSILNDSRYFSVIGGLPGDVMHDVLEGLLPYEVKELLKICILEEKYFSLDELNERIFSFDYGYHNDSNKPSAIKRVHLNSDAKGIKQKAAQMWCLGVHLPIIIGDLVDEQDEHWMLYLQLLSIMNILFSPEILENDIVFLEHLIDAHHQEFSRLYPGRSITPKIHYIIHYPYHIQSLGPLVRSWTMRFEGKHNFFKRLSQRIGNFTNLPLSLSERHQELMCSEMTRTSTSNSSFLIKPIEVSEGCVLGAGETYFFDILSEKQPTILEETNLQECKRITFYGTEYRVGTVLHVGTEDMLPVFGEVVNLYVQERCSNGIFFILCLCHTVCLEEHYNAYEVVRQMEPKHMAVYHHELKSSLPLHFVIKKGVDTSRMFVVPRHQLLE